MSILDCLKLAKQLIDAYKGKATEMDEVLPDYLEQVEKDDMKSIEYTAEYVRTNEQINVASLFNEVYLFHKKMVAIFPEENDEESLCQFSQDLNAAYKEVKEKFNQSEYATKMLLFASDKIWKGCMV